MSNPTVSTTLSTTLRTIADRAEAMEQRCERQAATIASLQAEAAQSALAREELFQENRRLREALKDANISVVAFGSVWAVTWARDHGLPNDHLHPTHYDILEKAGATMDGFTRAASEGKNDGE